MCLILKKMLFKYKLYILENAKMFFLNLKLSLINLKLTLINLKLSLINLKLTLINLKLSLINLKLTLINLNVTLINLNLSLINLRVKRCRCKFLVISKVLLVLLWYSLGICYYYCFYCLLDLKVIALGINIRVCGVQKLLKYYNLAFDIFSWW